MKLSDEEVVGRIAAGREFMEPFALIDLNQSNKFRDPKCEEVTSLDDLIIPGVSRRGSNIVTEVTQGVVNQQAANILTQIAAIAVGTPEIQVRTVPNAPPDANNIVEQMFSLWWRSANMRRSCAHALTHSALCGLGAVSFRWDKKRFLVVEPLDTWDMAVDPFTRDWKHIEYMARRIYMSKRKAVDRYGKDPFLFAEQYEASALDREAVEMWLYFDDENEHHVYNDEVIAKMPNLWEMLPLITLVGDYDPTKSPFPIGSVQMSAGLQDALTELWLTLYYTARNGGPITALAKGSVDADFEKAWQDARQCGVLQVKTRPDLAMQRFPGETVSPALLPATQQFMSSLDALMGTNGYDRGVVDNPARFATEAMAVINRSGARAWMRRNDYETWMLEVAEAFIEGIKRFGGPAGREDERPELDDIWQAFMSVVDVRMVTGSSSYKDPAAEVQPRMMLLQALVAAAPTFAQAGQPIPNFKAHVDKILTGMGEQDTSQFWAQIEQAEEALNV